MLNWLESGKQQKKPLGEYLIEAGLINLDQLKVALIRQKASDKRLGEIVADLGWVQQQTIEYLIEKVVLPEQRVVKNKLFPFYRNKGNNLALVKPNIPARENRDTSELMSATKREVEVYFFPKTTIRVLLFAIACFVLASLFGQFSQFFLPDYPSREAFAQLFNVDDDYSLPAMYSWCALLFSSILLAIITQAKKLSGGNYVGYWRALAIIFFYLSMDEAVSIHEKIGDGLKGLHAHGFLTYTWVIAGGIFAIVTFLAFLKFLVALPAKTRGLFLVAGTIFVGGALGLEIVGGYIKDVYGSDNMAYVMEANIEEFLEMLGVIVFIYSLLSYMSSYMKGLSLRVHFISDKQQRCSI